MGSKCGGVAPLGERRAARVSRPRGRRRGGEEKSTWRPRQPSGAVQHHRARPRRGYRTVRYFEGTPVPATVVPLGLLIWSFTRGGFPVRALGVSFHLVALLFALSGSLTISKTLRIPSRRSIAPVRRPVGRASSGWRRRRSRRHERRAAEPTRQRSSSTWCRHLRGYAPERRPKMRRSSVSWSSTLCAKICRSFSSTRSTVWNGSPTGLNAID